MTNEALLIWITKLIKIMNNIIVIETIIISNEFLFDQMQIFKMLVTICCKYRPQLEQLMDATT